MSGVNIKHKLKKRIDDWKGDESWSEFCSIALSLRNALGISPNIVAEKMKDIIDEKDIDKATRRALVSTGSYKKMQSSEDKVEKIAGDTIKNNYRSDSDKSIKATETKDLAQQITENAKKMAKDVMK